MKQALLIIDVQNDYFKGGKCELYQPDFALQAIKHLLDAFREKDLPIFYIQHVGDDDAAFFIAKTYGVQIHNAITPTSRDQVITKHYPNSFFETKLQTKLNYADVDEVIICGMMTHMCIDTTTRAAFELGYKVTLISDACATKDLVWEGIRIPARTVHNVYMASLSQRFATIMTSDAYLNTV